MSLLLWEERALRCVQCSAVRQCSQAVWCGVCVVYSPRSQTSNRVYWWISGAPRAAPSASIGRLAIFLVSLVQPCSHAACGLQRSLPGSKLDGQQGELTGTPPPASGQSVACSSRNESMIREGGREHGPWGRQGRTRATRLGTRSLLDVDPYLDCAPLPKASSRS